MSNFLDSTGLQRLVTNLKNWFMPKSGGTFTGNVSGKYFTGTWLRSTSTSRLSSKSDKIAVFDSSGWLYYRNLNDLLTDTGLKTLADAISSGKIAVDSSGNLTISGDVTITGTVTTDQTLSEFKHGKKASSS